MTIKLSKSRFVAGCQCLKCFYLQVHQPELAAEPEGAAGAIIEQGRKVGLLARKMFPAGVEDHGDDLDQALRAKLESQTPRSRQTISILLRDGSLQPVAWFGRIAGRG